MEDKRKRLIVSSLRADVAQYRRMDEERRDNYKRLREAEARLALETAELFAACYVATSYDDTPGSIRSKQVVGASKEVPKVWLNGLSFKLGANRCVEVILSGDVDMTIAARSGDVINLTLRDHESGTTTRFAIKICVTRDEADMFLMFDGI